MHYVKLIALQCFLFSCLTAQRNGKNSNKATEKSLELSLRMMGNFGKCLTLARCSLSHYILLINDLLWQDSHLGKQVTCRLLSWFRRKLDSGIMNWHSCLSSQDTWLMRAWKTIGTTASTSFSWRSSECGSFMVRQALWLWNKRSGFNLSHCFVFLGNTPYSHSVSLNPSV